MQDDDLKAIDFDSACTVAGGAASREPEVSERVGGRFEAGHVLTPRYRSQASSISKHFEKKRRYRSTVSDLGRDDLVQNLELGKNHVCPRFDRFTIVYSGVSSIHFTAVLRGTAHMPRAGVEAEIKSAHVKTLVWL